MAKPTEKPGWGQNVSALLTPAYSAVKRALGFIDAEIPTPGGLNAVLKNISDWIDYVDDQSGVVVPGGRLTLTSGTPLTTANVSGSTIYYSPFRHNKIALYNGTSWGAVTFSELSQTLADTTKSPAAATAGVIADLFVWDDNGTIRCTRGPAWSSASSRGTGAGTTELEQFEGRHVNKVAITNGPAARRGLYVGTIFVSVADSLVHDDSGQRYCWNMFNRADRHLLVQETTDSWLYTSLTWRQVRATTSNKVEYLCGLLEDPIFVEARCIGTCTASLGLWAGIGLNSTSVNSAQITLYNSNQAAAEFAQGYARYEGYPSLGRVEVVWLERTTASGTNTFYGDAGLTQDLHQTGLVARVRG